MSQPQSIQRRMAIQQEVEGYLNKIIGNIKCLVDDTGIAGSQLDKAQLSNLRNVAMETPSAELVRNFILYQVGRDTGAKSWRFKDFGETLVAQLKALRVDAASIVREVDGIKEPPAELVDPVWIELVRHYIGQLNRYFYYRKEVRHGAGL